MRKINHALALVEIATVLIALTAISSSPAYASGFIEDSSLKGNVFYWQRQRDRRDTDPASEYQGSIGLIYIMPRSTVISTISQAMPESGLVWTSPFSVLLSFPTAAPPHPMKLASARRVPAGMKSGMATAAVLLFIKPH